MKHTRTIALPLLAALTLAAAPLLRADTLTLTNGAVIHGDVEESDRPGTIALRIGGGRIWIDESDVDSIEENEKGVTPPPAEPQPTEPAPQEPTPPSEPAPEGRAIDTTHRITLKYGSEIRGNLVEGDDDSQVELAIPGVGNLAIPREQVEEVVAEAGTMTLPPARPEPAPEAPAPPAEPTFEDIIANIAARVVEEHYADGWGWPASFGQEPELEELAYELTRQRSENRVRAENELRRRGVAALPFIRIVAEHPFDLARRAAQRLVRDAGAWEGAPMAIEALDDPDPFVRAIAGEAVADLIGREVRYDPSGSSSSWQRAQEDAWALWLSGEARRLEVELRTVLEDLLFPDGPGPLPADMAARTR